MGTDPTGLETLIGISSASSIGASLNNLNGQIGLNVAEVAYAVIQGANAQAALVTIVLSGLLSIGTPVLSEAFGKLFSVLQKGVSSGLSQFLPKVGGKTLLPGILHASEAELNLLFKKGAASAGSSSELRRQYANLIGVGAGSLEGIGAQFHHLIPVQWRRHSLLKRLNFQIDSALNALPLNDIAHLGPHSSYSNAIKRVLDDIDRLGGSNAKKRELILATMTNATAKILDGNALRANVLAESEWYTALRPF